MNHNRRSGDPHRYRQRRDGSVDRLFDDWAYGLFDGLFDNWPHRQSYGLFDHCREPAVYPVNPAVHLVIHPVNGVIRTVNHPGRGREH